jgi:hypothetical protein
MSDSFEMLVDVEVTPDKAPAVASKVLAGLRKAELITGRLNSDCTLGGKGYRPGPRVSEIYKIGKREGKFWELVTCGVEPKIGKSFNEWALGPVFEGIICPHCHTHFAPENDICHDFTDAACAWLDGDAAPFPCSQCSQRFEIEQWECRPPLGCGNLSFRFWNWPPLVLPGWTVEIPAMIASVTGHQIVRTYGHL